MSKKSLPKIIRPPIEKAQADAAGATANPTDIPVGAELVPPEPAASLPQRVASPSAERARRRSKAIATVERHANLAAVGGVIPVPLVNAAGVAAINIRMMKTLSELYGVPFRRDRARVIALGVASGVLPSGLSMITTSTLYFVVPGSILLGLAVSSVAASALTRSLGTMLVDYFEQGATDFPVAEHAAAPAQG